MLAIADGGKRRPRQGAILYRPATAWPVGAALIQASEIRGLALDGSLIT